MIEFEDLEGIGNKKVLLEELDNNLCEKCRFQFGNGKEIVKPFIITSSYGGKTPFRWLACFCEYHAFRITNKEELSEKDVFTIRLLYDASSAGV